MSNKNSIIAIIVCIALIVAMTSGIVIIIAAMVIEEARAQEIGQYYNITEDQRTLIAKVTYLEAGSCSEGAQRAVASVIFNRLEAGYWGSTIEQVIYYPNSFSVASLIPTCRPSAQAYEAVDYVIEHGSTLPEKVRYFRADYDHQWENYKNYCEIDNIYFGYFTDENKH